MLCTCCGNARTTIIAFVIALCGCNAAFAQNTTITGSITSAEGPIPFANVSLKSADESELLNTWSDSVGNYSIIAKQNIPYIITASYIGYKNYSSGILKPCEGKDSVILNIFLEAGSKDLNEVVVQAKRKLFETDKGKLIFNIQNSALTSGQTVFDLLKKLPGISITQNDEILFRGSTGINVMTDGRMTYLSGNQLANYLKGLSAEDLDKIELITAPQAEYDAAGNTGIINIVPKKNNKKGYAIDLRSSVSKGKFWMHNEQISSSMRFKNWSIYGMFDFKTPHSFSQKKSENSAIINGDAYKLQREATAAYKINYYTWRAGMDWQFKPNQKIGLNYEGYFDDFKNTHLSTVKRLPATGMIHSYIRSENNITEPYHYDGINFNYEFKIDTSGKKISVDAHYTSYRNFSDGLMSTKNYSADDALIYENILQSHQPGFVKIKSAQADLVLPYEKFSLKSGIKYAVAENDNRYSFDSLFNGAFIEIASMTNHFRYTERIAAAYISGSKKFNQTNIDIGLRMEYTDANGYTVKNDFQNKWKYTKLFPSLSVEQPINDQQKIDVAVSRRINRPSYTNLNPVRWYSDQYFYYSGNPNLVPELAWLYAITYSLRNRYILSATYNQSINYINSKLTIDDNGFSIKSQSANFGIRKRFDLMASAPLQLFRFWEIQLMANTSYTSYPISQRNGERFVSKYAGNFSIQQTFSLPNEIKINLSAYHNTSELRGIYKTSPVSFADFGVRKSFLKNKLEAQFSVNDIFNTNRYKAISQSDVVDYRYNDKPYSRVISLSLKYHLGGTLFKGNSTKTEEQKRL